MSNLLWNLWRIGCTVVGLIFLGAVFGQGLLQMTGGDQAVSGMYSSPWAFVFVALGFWVVVVGLIMLSEAGSKAWFEATRQDKHEEYGTKKRE